MQQYSYLISRASGSINENMMALSAQFYDISLDTDLHLWRHAELGGGGRESV